MTAYENLRPRQPGADDVAIAPKSGRLCRSGSLCSVALPCGLYGCHTPAEAAFDFEVCSDCGHGVDGHDLRGQSGTDPGFGCDECNESAQLGQQAPCAAVAQ